MLRPYWWSANGKLLSRRRLTAGIFAFPPTAMTESTTSPCIPVSRSICWILVLSVRSGSSSSASNSWRRTSRSRRAPCTASCTSTESSEERWILALSLSASSTSLSGTSASRLLPV